MQRQLDIFDDGRDLALRNDIAQALLHGDWRAAQQGVDALRAEFGDAPALAPATRLIEHLRWQEAASSPLVVDACVVLELRQRIERLLAPAATDLMGPADAQAWLARQWHWLAELAQPLPWRAEEQQVHAASLYLRAGEWAAAADAVRAIASWRRIPQPLLWMTQACWHLQRADAAWPLLAESLWLASGRAKALIAHLPDKPLLRLARRFEAEFEPEDDDRWAWLPAWALIDQATLAEVLSGASSDAEVPAVRGFRLVIALLRLERAGRHHDIVEHRRRLKSLDARLFALYMRTR
jgi:hypothetical protein